MASPSSTSSTSESIRDVAEDIPHTENKAEADAEVDDNNDPIDLFLSLPTEVLERIFIEADDIGFWNLAHTCTRSESIALQVLSKRYANRYFVINMYCSLFSLSITSR